MMTTNRTIQAHDFMSLTSRKMTDEGYLIAPGNLARTGVQEYRAFELGLDADGMDPMRVIRLHRPADEVFNPASMASFESKPITIEHPKEAVTADNWSELAKGEVRDVTRSGDLMTGTLLVRAKDAIEAVQTGKVQLSNGYTFELDMTSGQTADGRAYDGIQRNIRGNHVALVDAARCGSACRIADSQPNITKGKTMTDAKRKVAVDGIPLEVEDTAANVIETLVGQRNEARDALAKLQPTAAKAAELQTALDKANADIEQLKKDVITPAARDAMVADWSAMLATAKRLVPEITTDGKTCHAIRREVIATVSGKDATAKAVADAVLAGKALDVADEEHVRATFNALAASVKTEAWDAATSGNDTALAAALVGDASGKQTTIELTGRDKFMAQSTQAWQQK